MNHSTLVWAALLCAGLVPTLAPRPAGAQTAPVEVALSPYAQVLEAGKRNYKAKNYAAAAVNARTMLRLAAATDEKTEALLLLAESLYRSENYDGAIEGWNLLLEFTRDDKDEGNGALAHLGLGRTYGARGDYARAIPHLKAFEDTFDREKLSSQDAEALNAIKPLLLLPLADAYYHTRQNDLAKQQFEQTKSLGQVLTPLLVPVLARIGQLDIEQGNYKRAQTEFERGLAVFVAIGLEGEGSKPYFERRVATLQSLATVAGAGTTNASALASLKRDAEFDDRISKAIRLLVDDLFVDDAFMNTLGE